MASQTTQKDAATSQKIEHQHDTTCHDACNKLEAKLREEEWESKVHPGRYGTQSPEPHQEKTAKDPRANVARKESVSDAAERLEAKLYEEEWNNRPHGW